VGRRPKDDISDIDRRVDAWLDELTTERGLARHSLDAYGRDLGAFVAGLGRRGIRRPDRIRTVDVRAHLADLEARGLAPRSQARALAAIRGFLRFLVRRGDLAADPAADITMRRPPGKLPRALGEREVGPLLADPPAPPRRPLRDRALLELLYACGLRVSEAADLELAQTNLEAGFLTVVGKGDKERVVPLGSHARAALVDYLAHERPKLERGKRPPWVFLGPSGRRLSRQSIWKLVRRRAQAAALAAGVSPHTLRHTFATHLVGGGADLRVVQTLLVHADIGTTEIYTHVAPGRLRSVHRRHHPRA